VPENLDRWRRHTPMTDPGSATLLLEGLPATSAAICQAIQGVLIHWEWMKSHGLPEPKADLSIHKLLPLSRQLRHIAKLDPKPLIIQRPAHRRLPGTCRDYALMLCGLLRHQQIPARVRCGFADYFTCKSWIDHWLCEYWSCKQGGWCRCDAQIDEVQRQRLGIDFDTSDVPPTKFIAAGDALNLCRIGQNNPDSFGGEGTKGLLYIRVNVLRDHYARSL
jgi:hypothetical protein